MKCECDQPKRKVWHVDRLERLCAEHEASSANHSLIVSGSQCGACGVVLHLSHYPAHDMPCPVCKAPGRQAPGNPKATRWERFKGWFRG